MLTSKYCYVNRHLYERVTLRASMPLFILWIESFKTYSNMDSIKFWYEEMKHVLNEASSRVYLLTGQL
jgi:hypothetical protein